MNVKKQNIGDILQSYISSEMKDDVILQQLFKLFFLIHRGFHPLDFWFTVRNNDFLVALSSLG